MKSINLIILFCVSFGVARAQFKNIKLMELADDIYSPAGPSVTINQKNPQNIIIGIAPNRLLYTVDNGTTWSETKLESEFGVAGYPTVISDFKGDLYYFHLTGKEKGDNTWLKSLVCQKSADGGATWKSGEPFGLNPPKVQYRPQVTVGYKKHELFTTWTQFDKFGENDTTFHSNILFSLSESEGKKWTKVVQLNQVPGDCASGDNTAMGAMSAVDAKGKLFAAWSNGGMIYFDRSYDHGKTWLRNDLVVAEQQGGWNLDIPGIGQANGLPMLMIDNSPSRYHGSLYLLWADQRNGKNDTDIWLMRTGNGGDNWSVPLRVNKDLPAGAVGGKGKHQFLPSLAIDQTTGYIYVIYYDRRNYDDLQTDVYLAYSSDGGMSFTDVKVSENPFMPAGGDFSIEHIGIAAHKGVIVPVWTRVDNGKKSVWMAIITDADFLKK